MMSFIRQLALCSSAACLLTFTSPDAMQSQTGGGGSGVSTNPTNPDPSAMQQFWRRYYEALFGSGTSFGPGYDAFTTKYSLAQTISGVGIYSGVNQHGAAFSLEVVSVAPVDITQMGMAPRVLQEALDSNLQWIIIEAVATGGQGSMEVVGMALARQSATIPAESMFVPLMEVEILHDLIPESANLVLSTYFPVPTYCNGNPQTCSDDAQGVYDDAIEAAEATAQTDTGAENAMHTGILMALTQTLVDTVAMNLVTYRGDVENCAGTSQWGAIVQKVGELFKRPDLSTDYLARTMENCLNDAVIARYGRNVAAKDVYNAGELAEGMRHTAVAASIAAALEAAIEAAQQELEDTQGNCFEVCGYWFLCLPILF